MLRSYPVRLIGTIVLVVVGLAVVARMGLLADNGQAAPPRSSSAPPVAERSLPAGQVGPGVWLVGTDVAPGTYRSDGAVDGYCMWSRHSSASGGPFDGIIASDGTSGPGQVVVAITPGDALFRTDGCAPFVKVG